MAKKKSFLRKVLTVLMVLCLAGATAMIYTVYTFIYKGNIKDNGKEKVYLYIKSDTRFDELIQQLQSKNILININTFKQLAEYKGYDKAIKPGKYLLKPGMSNNQVVNILKAGLQEKIKFNLANIRTIEQLAHRLSRNTEIDSADFTEYIYSEEFVNETGLNKEKALCLFMPEEYVFDTWATSTNAFIKECKAKRESYWKSHIKQIERTRLTPDEVYILASIVQLEQTLFVEERPTIAGVYINRLRKGMKLQADPTVIFATGDFTINRVRSKHLELDSPYNTYLYEGLPPGPICIPTLHAINAVLTYQNHNYMFFCAHEDLSGRHYFTASYNEHVKYANRYRDALDKKGI